MGTASAGGEKAGEQYGSHAVEIGRRGTHSDKGVHVGSLMPERSPGSPVELPARPELDRRGQYPEKVPVAENGQGNTSQTISMKDRKAMIARRFITKNALKIIARAELIRTGDKSTFNDYESLIGPVPIE